MLVLEHCGHVLDSVHMPVHMVCGLVFFFPFLLDRKVFLATWKEIPPSNEVQGAVENVSLTAGTCTCTCTFNHRGTNIIVHVHVRYHWWDATN